MTVPVIQALKGFIRRHVWLDAQSAQEVDGILNLGHKFIPQLDGEVYICGAKGANEPVLESLDGVFCRIDSVVVQLNKLKAHIFRPEVSFFNFCCLIIHDVYFQSVPFAHQVFKVCHVCRQYAF